MENNIIPKWLVGTLGILLIIFIGLQIADKAESLSSRVQGKKPDNTMSVSAEGRVDAVPDMATVTLGVSSQGGNQATLKDDNNKKVKAVIDYVKKQGINEKDIKTSQLSLYPQYDWTSGTQKVIGYQADQTVTIKVRGVDKSQDTLENILDGGVNAGANQIQGVYFEFEDSDGLKQQARKLAIGKAKEKAQELAGEAGLTLGKVVSVSESGGGYYPPMPYAESRPAMGMGGADVKSIAPDIQPGQQEITLSMTVVFEVK
jgi:uncharacterized protein